MYKIVMTFIPVIFIIGLPKFGAMFSFIKHNSTYISILMIFTLLALYFFMVTIFKIDMLIPILS